MADGMNLRGSSEYSVDLSTSLVYKTCDIYRYTETSSKILMYFFFEAKLCTLFIYVSQGIGLLSQVPTLETLNLGMNFLSAIPDEVNNRKLQYFTSYGSAWRVCVSTRTLA